MNWKKTASMCRLLRCVATLCSIWFMGSATAMTFTAAPPVLYLGGGVVATDWDAWQEAMQRFGSQIDTVVLHDSGGGDSAAGRNIGTDIRKRKLRTVVHGRCSSACANMFLGGSERQFALTDKKITAVLGYHGSYNKKTHELNRRRPGDYFVQMTDGKMDSEFVERFIRLEKQRGLMRFFHPMQRAVAGDPLVMLCYGDEDRAQLFEQCERIPEIDALSKGVVTTWGVYEIEPPPKVKPERATRKSWEGSGNEPPAPIIDVTNK